MRTLRIRLWLLCMFVAGLLCACTATERAQVASAATYGQLFCAVDTSTGPLVVAVVDATEPSAVLAVGATKAFVDAACAKAGVALGALSSVATVPPVDVAAAVLVSIVPPAK